MKTCGGALLACVLLAGCSGVSEDEEILFNRNSGLFVMDADGTDVRQLGKMVGFDYFPRNQLSPNGKEWVGKAREGWILVGNVEEAFDALANNTVSRNRRVTDEVADLLPVWLPNGREIAFEHETKIYVVNVDGGEARRLTNTSDSASPSINEAAPVWSPDGMKVAFLSDWYGDVWGLFVMKIDGTDIRRLTNIKQTSFNLGSPLVWSPDGSKIVFFDSARGDDDEIFVVNVDGTGIKQLTDNDYDDRSPDWSPNSDKIVFASDRGGDSMIFVMDADGTNVVGTGQAGWYPSWAR